MLTHQNWKFLAWLSCKMQTNKFGPLTMTTGDNINLSIIANVNWLVRDPIVAAGRSVDTTAGRDSLKMIRDDVILQVTSSLASLVGAIQYGSQGTSSMHSAAREGADPPPQPRRKTAKKKKKSVAPQASSSQAATAQSSLLEDAMPLDISSQDIGASPTSVADVDLVDEPEPEAVTGRRALWDPQRLENAVADANMITRRYGVEILSINLISASPSDDKLVEIMSRGAVAAVAAEENMKESRAKAQSTIIAAEAEQLTAQALADAMLIRARSEAEAIKIAASADAESERIRAQGSKDAGQLMGESEVAVALAKLKIAYGPFEQNQSNTFFFGLHGPGDLPTALLGNSLAAQTGIAGLNFGPGAGGGS